MGGGWPGGQATEALRLMLLSAISRGELHLLLHSEPDVIHLVQGQRTRERENEAGQVIKQYRQIQSFPVYELDGYEGWVCDDVSTCRLSADSAQRPLTLLLRSAGYPPPDECAYTPFTAAVSLEFDLAFNPGNLWVRSGPANRIEWIVTEAAANALEFGGRTLGDVLREERPLRDAPPDEVVDLDDDGMPDAWRIGFGFTVETVALAGPPVSCPDCRPLACE